MSEKVVRWMLGNLNCILIRWGTILVDGLSRSLGDLHNEMNLFSS